VVGNSTREMHGVCFPVWESKLKSLLCSYLAHYKSSTRHWPIKAHSSGVRTRVQRAWETYAERKHIAGWGGLVVARLWLRQVGSVNNLLGGSVGVVCQNNWHLHSTQPSHAVAWPLESRQERGLRRWWFAAVTYFAVARIKKAATSKTWSFS